MAKKVIKNNQTKSKKNTVRKTKILAITGNRADYDLLSYLFKMLSGCKKFDFSLIVCGAHLNKGYEATLDEIKNDGVKILKKIKNITNEKSIASRVNATGILVSELASILEKERPDLFLISGDREETIASAIACLYEMIPSMHFFAGDFTASGHVDNPIRLAVAKMASLHIVTNIKHKERLISLGEDKRRIFNIGSPALDKFREERKISRTMLFKSLKIKEKSEFALLIYHPPLGLGLDKFELQNILDALIEKEIFTIVSYPNTDFGSEEIKKIYDKYKNHNNFYFYKSLERNIFINLYRHASFQIGNSSSGIVEAASIPLPVINVGDRQKNRGNSINIIHVNKDKKNILSAIKKVRDKKLLNKIKNMKNPFGDGKSVMRAFNIIKKLKGKYQDYFYKTEDPLKNKRKDDLIKRRKR